MASSAIEQLKERVDMPVTGQNGVTAETLASISTPDRVETSLGTLEFDDGAPSDATSASSRSSRGITASFLVIP